MTLYASQPDCYIVCTSKITGEVVSDLFVGEDTNGIWRVGRDDGGNREWDVTWGRQFTQRDFLLSYLEQQWHVEIVR